MYELTIRRHFDASHIVEGHPGKCANLHGHRWVAEALIRCPKLNAIGLAIDFADVKRLLDTHLPDHRHLNDVLPENWPATAEGLSHWLHEALCPEIARLGGELLRLTIWESPDCAATYRPDPPDEAPSGREQGGSHGR